MPTIRLFAGAREAAGTDRDTLDGATVRAVLDAAVQRYGAGFEAILRSCRVWVNGEPAEPGDAVAPADEVAVLPPVSGG
jgi:sulfur-carrier protein